RAAHPRRRTPQEELPQPRRHEGTASFAFLCLRGPGTAPPDGSTQRDRMTAMSHAEHQAQAPRSVRCFIVTVSDTRTEATDASGRAIADLLTAAGHQIAGRTIVKDDADLVRGTIERQLASPDVDAIITTGGTGITSRDSTYEAVSGLLQKRLDGFGELFRMLSYQQ